MKASEVQDTLNLAQTMLEQWLRYRQYFWRGISDAPITPEEEREFLETTSSLAQNVRKLSQRVDEKKLPFRSKELSELLKTTISIAHFRNMQPADQKVFYKEWHHSQIFLGRLVGAYKLMEEGYRPIEKEAGKKGGKKSGPKGNAFIGIVVLVVIAGGIGVAYFLGLI